MKKTKLLSFLLAGVLLFQTTGIDALATAPAVSDPVTVTVEDPSDETSAPLPTGGEIVTDPETPEGGETITNPETPGEGDDKQDPENPGEGDDKQDPENPGEGDDKQDPENPGEGDDKQDPENPGEGDDKQDPENPGEGDDKQDPENPGEDDDKQDPEAPAEDEDDEQDPEESVSENSVSENSVSENSVSENDLPEEDMEVSAFDIFPGLGDEYTFSAQQIADKQVLSEHVGDIVSLNSVEAELFPDAEGLYELGEVVYLADTEAEAQQIAEAFGGALDSYSYGVAVISLPEKATVSLAVAAAADSDVKLPAVWPNYYNYVNSMDDVSIDAFSNNDPNYSAQWQHDYIGTRYAWTAGYKGQGIKVAVIDSGVQASHEDLNGVTGKLFVSKEGTAGSAYNVDNGSHGTHVAGIIAAVANNGKGGAGIAPEATIRSYCVMSKASGGRSGNAADIMRAIEAAVKDGNDIINMSLGSSMYTAQYASVVNDAYKKGVAIFASAGNDDSDGYNFPAAFPGSISVAAIDQNGARASFSNFGSTVNLAFPGVKIKSTIPTGYGDMSGTSQASPAAAGTAAVILSADASIRSKSGKARVDALLAKMKSSTTRSSGSGMGSGTTWLPGVLKIATEATVPDAPVISIKETPSPKDRSGKTYIAENVTVTLTATTAISGIEIWYSTDGKSPSYKNGAVTNAVRYTAPFSLGGAKSKTVKAIAVNPHTGKISKAASKTVTLTPIPNAVNVTSAGNVSRIAAGKSLKLTAAVTPSYAISTKVAWSVNDAAKTAGITVSNGTVKTKSTTPAGTYTVTATAVGSDGAAFNGQADSFTIEVITKADIKKVAFLDSKNKTYKKCTLNKDDTLPLKDYLKVTKLDNSAGTAADVVWSSGNLKVATVSAEGIVTAVGPGKAVIKATSNDGGNKSASCTVTVNQPITGITLSGPTKVASGKGVTLRANIQPANATNKKLTWAVTGNAMVTVSSSGKVTAKKGASGSCSVTATAKDGSQVTSAAYNLTIVSGMITKITLSDKSVNLFNSSVNANTPLSKTLTAKVEGSGSFESTLVEWTSSAPAIASVENGVVTAHTAGKATITCTATDGSNKKASCKVNVMVPMSKLMIGTAGRNGNGYIAPGKSIRLSAHYYSYCGKPNNTKVIWKSSNEAVAKVDKNGKVTVPKNATAGSTATITATAADGSNLVSNEYTVTVSKLFKKMTLEYAVFKVDGKTEDGWIPILDENWTTGNFTISISGGSNPGCYKGVNDDGLPYLQPIPGKVTTSKSSSSMYITNRDLQKMKLTVTLQDGSGLKATTTANVARFGNGVVGYYFPRKR